MKKTVGILAVVAASQIGISPAEQARLATPLSSAEAWERLPKALAGEGKELPVWARLIAGDLPKTAAAFLELDLAQRAKSPIDPGLRAAMRWVAAHANGCAYAEAYAAADAARAGVSPERIAALGRQGYPGWSEKELGALEFAHGMTVDSASVTDGQFARLVADFGANPAASMVLLMAYANFQDRALLCLRAEVEPGGPQPAVEVTFDPETFRRRPPAAPTPPVKPELLPPSGADLVVDDDDAWLALDYDELQTRLEVQRDKPTRLPIPAWEAVAANLPADLGSKPSDIVWYRIAFGYAPELAVPFERFMRTAGSEVVPSYDRVFGQSLFWITTKAVNCPYCMGHCEMNWEVAGLTPDEIAQRSRLLAGGDWSSFTTGDQLAFAFARKLARAPASVSDVELGRLIEEMGREKALAVALNASRHHYMTRISNGFQLKLERENVFYDYYGVTPPTKPALPAGGRREPR